jgi:hypothetical protein
MRYKGGRNMSSSTVTVALGINRKKQNSPKNYKLGK